MRFHTLECRWFFDGEPDGSFCRWFQSGQPLDWSTVPSRTDVYLALGDAVDMGVKVREGRFEVKGRSRELGAVRLAPRVHAELEEWLKWSYEADEVGNVIDDLLQADLSRIRVTKQRVQRQFAVTMGGEVREIELTWPPPRRIFAEVARVRVRGHRAWSFGLEARPVDERLCEHMVAWSEAFLADVPMSLTRECALSYPAWLAAIGEVVQRNER